MRWRKSVRRAARAGAPPPPDGIAGWILAKQAEFYRMLSGTIRSAKTDGSAVWLLMGISFALRRFPCRGPRPRQGGDLLLPGRQRGDLEARHHALFCLRAAAGAGRGRRCRHAAALLGATAGKMNEAVRWIEIVSYALIAAIGARLLWVKGGASCANALRCAARIASAPQRRTRTHHHHASRSWPRSSRS